MSKKILVGNVPLGVDQDKIFDLFSEAGDVRVVTIPTNSSGRPCGFAIVEMASRVDAERAVSSLQQADLEGRQISLTHVEKENKPVGGFFSKWFGPSN